MPKRKVRDEKFSNIDLDTLILVPDLQASIASTAIEELHGLARTYLTAGYSPSDLSDQFEFAYYRGADDSSETLSVLEEIFLELADMES